MKTLKWISTVILISFLGSMTWVSASYIVPNYAITQIKLAPRPGPSPTVSAGGVALSASSGTYSLTNSTYATVTNLSVTITTTGRPVFVGLIPDTLNDLAFISTNASGSSNYRFVRGSTPIGTGNIANQNSGAIYYPVSLNILDFPSAGTYTYTFQVNAGAATTVNIYNVNLFAYEL